MGVRVIGEGEQMDVTESRYEPGESGPETHVHREHADSFWVLDGELEFEVGREAVRTRVTAGGFVLVPPGLAHTFRNAGTADARFLNFHAPGKGFAAHLRGENDDFDTFDPPPDGGRPANDVLLVDRGGGEDVALRPNRVVFKAQGLEYLSLTETTLAPGSPGPVPHLHETFVDSFYVLEGALAVEKDGERIDLHAGEYAYVPPGTLHTFANASRDAPTRLLNVMAPGGFEQYLKEVAALPGSPDAQAMALIASRYDFRAAD